MNVIAVSRWAAAMIGSTRAAQSLHAPEYGSGKAMNRTLPESNQVQSSPGPVPPASAAPRGRGKAVLRPVPDRVVEERVFPEPRDPRLPEGSGGGVRQRLRGFPDGDPRPVPLGGAIARRVFPRAPPVEGHRPRPG